MTGFTFDSSRTARLTNVCSRTFPRIPASQVGILRVPQMPSPLEDRIRELCAQVLSAQNDLALDRFIPQLQVAVKEYVQETRTRVVEVIRHTFRSDSDDQAACFGKRRARRRE